MAKFVVYYMKTDFFPDGMLGHGWLVKLGRVPTRARLLETHARVGEVDAGSMDDVYHEMQAELWSPNGEARPLIQSLGLSHTSMSIGDCIEADDGLWMVDYAGFKKLEVD